MSYAHLRYFGAPTFTVASGTTAVIETRGMGRLVAYFANTCNATPVADASGTALLGTPSASALTSGEPIDVAAYYYLIAPATSAAQVLILA